MLTKEEKQKTIGPAQLHEKDTGSPEAQIAILTKEIERLTLHLKKHSQDFHSRKGLLRMVAKRRKLLTYLKNEDEKRYHQILKKIGAQSELDA